MGWIADQLEGKAPRISEDRVKELSESTTLSDIAAIPFAALGTGLDALSYPADAARAAVGRLAGVRGSGRETFFGTAPSGRELLGLGPGREGSFEASDIPAAIAVGALDPLWALQVGKLSKVGELAQRAGNLDRAASAYKASGKAAEAISELNALRGVQSELRAAGASGRTRLAPTLAEQAKLGQRSLISLGLPGMESVPLVRGAGAFAALGKAGALAGKVTNPLFESIFRTESRISPKTAEAAAEQLGLNARDAAAMYGASSDVETEGIRAGLRITDDEASRTARFIAERKDSTAALRAALHPEIQDAYRKAGSYYATKIAEANAQGFVGKANRLKMEAEDTFRRLDASAGLDAGNPTWKQLGFAVERAETRAQMGEYVGKLVRERESKLAPIRARMAALAESRDPERLARKVALLEDMLANTNDYKEIASIRKQVRELGRFVPGTSTWIPNERGALLKEISSIVTKAQNGFSKADAAKMAKFQAAAQRVEADYAGKIAIGIAHGRIAKAGLKTIPPEVIEEAKRIAAANGNMLDEVRLSGAPAPELADQYISYLARKADPNGVELLQRLKGKVPDAFERVVAEMNRAGGGSSIQRVKEFEGLGVSQINDWFRSALRDAGAPNITDDVRLFEENPAEIMLRKLTADFKRAANARFQQSIISTFMVPNSAKRFGDVPLEEFIKTGRLAGLTIGKNVQFGDDIAKGLKEVGLDGMYIPKDIAAAALRTNKILDDPEELKGILGFVDKYNQLARFGVTQLFPSFHVRNAVSNSFMMWMGGMRDPAWMAKAAKVQMESTLPHNAALLKRAHDLGVIGTGMSDEIRKLQASKAGGLFEKYVTPVTKKVSKVGGAIEDNAKLAMFMDGRAKGLSDSEAAARVKKYLFDYGDLSRVEKKYLRRWAYFYCVPTDCEVLTRSGWKRWNEVQIGVDEALGLDVESGESKWTPITEVAVFDYCGELMTLGNGDGRSTGYFEFTPNHRWPIQYVDVNGTVKRDIVEGYNLRSNHKVLRCAPFNDWPKEGALTIRQAKIIGWLITDGCLVDGGNWTIYQHPKKFAAEIEELLGPDVGAVQTHPQSGVRMYPLKASIKNELKALGFQKKSDAIKFIGKLSKEVAEAMWDAMYKADGTTTSDRRHDHFACEQDDIFDVAQMLVQLFGGWMNRSTRGGYPGNKVTTMKVANALGVTWFNGQVWCPKTGTGTWLMRHEGKVIFTGNTYQRKIIPLVAQELAQHPIVGSLYNRVTGNYEGSIQNEIMPEWQRNQGNIYLGNDSEGNAAFANLDLPLSSVYDLAPEGKGIGRSLQKLAGMAAPMPKMILEAGAGVNLRSGRPRQGGLGEILLANSPAARFSSTTSALADSLLGDGQRGKPADVALSLVGLPTIRRMDTIESRKRRLRDRVEMALEKLASEGEAYRRLEYSPTQSGKDVAPLNTLLSELKRSRLK